MKNLFLGLVFALFAVQVNAASVTLTADIVSDTSNTNDAKAVTIGGKASLQSGTFVATDTIADEWKIKSSLVTAAVSITSFNPGALFRITVKDDSNTTVATGDFSGGGLNNLAFSFATADVYYGIFVDSIDEFGTIAAVGNDLVTYDIKVNAVHVSEKQSFLNKLL